jgi:hypothetical protein
MARMPEQEAPTTIGRACQPRWILHRQPRQTAAARASCLLQLHPMARNWRSRARIQGVPGLSVLFAIYHRVPFHGSAVGLPRDAGGWQCTCTAVPLPRSCPGQLAERWMARFGIHSFFGICHRHLPMSARRMPVPSSRQPPLSVQASYLQSIGVSVRLECQSAAAPALSSSPWCFGSVKWKLVPGPSLAVAHRRPPWCCTMDRQIDSPMPMPPGFVV